MLLVLDVEILDKCYCERAFGMILIGIVITVNVIVFPVISNLELVEIVLKSGMKKLISN